MDLVSGSWRGIMGAKGIAPPRSLSGNRLLQKASATPEWKADLDRNYWTTDFKPSAAFDEGAREGLRADARGADRRRPGKVGAIGEDHGHQQIRTQRRHPRLPAAVSSRPLHRRDVVSASTCATSPRCAGSRRSRQRARLRSRVVHVRRAGARARDHDGRGRRQDPGRARRLRRRQPRGGAHREHGAARRRVVPARLSAEPARRSARARAPRWSIAHFKTIADATDLPIICFQYPLAGGLGYPVDTLMKLVDAVPTVRAIKDWCNNPVQHERQIRLLQSLPRPVNVLTTHSSWLFSSLVLGCNGLLSGSGSVIADLQAALWQAVQANDLARAKQLNDRIYPARAGVLRRSVRRHAQPHEGSARHPRPHPVRRGAPAAREALRRRDRADQGRAGGRAIAREGALRLAA